MCASDYNEYPSRCHVRLEACLTGQDLSIIQAGECKLLNTKQALT